MALDGRARMVIADDHQRVLEATASMLAEDHDVVAAVSDGTAAIDAVAQHQPDIVVLDIAMPGLDGFQTAARIKASGSTAKIVFLSNHAGEDFVLAGLLRGASAFVAKPRMHADLRVAVNHVHAGRAFVPSAAVLPAWQRPPGQRHDLQIYSSESSVVDAMMEFFDSALDAGYSLLAVVPEPRRRALAARFIARGFDTDALIASSRYTAMDSDAALESVCRYGIPDPDLYKAAMEPVLERALKVSTASPPQLAMCGEIAPILCARQQYDTMVQLERIAHEYVAARPISLLCTYSTSCLDHCDTNITDTVCAEHTAIVSAQ